MRLVKCRKCGATVMSDEAMLQAMQEALNEANEKALKDKKNRNVYLQQASQISKMIKQANHRITTIEEKKLTKDSQLHIMHDYLIDNGIITEEKYNELIKIGDNRAKKLIAINERELEKVYGTFKSSFNMCNKTKSDTTANSAIRNTEKRANNGKG